MPQEPQHLRAGRADVALQLHIDDPPLHHHEPKRPPCIQRRRYGGEHIPVAAVHVQDANPRRLDPLNRRGGAHQPRRQRRHLRRRIGGRAIDRHAPHDHGARQTRARHGRSGGGGGRGDIWGGPRQHTRESAIPAARCCPARTARRQGLPCSKPGPQRRAPPAGLVGSFGSGPCLASPLHWTSTSIEQ